MSDTTTIVETALKVLEIVSLVGGGALLLFKMGRVTERVELLISQQGTEITALKSSVIAMNEVVIKQAVQNNRLDNQGARVDNLEKRTDERLVMIERHIDELRRGEGLISNFKRA